MAWGARNSTSTQVDDVPRQPGPRGLGVRGCRLGRVRRPGPPRRGRGEAGREQRARAREVVRFVHGESLVTRRIPLVHSRRGHYMGGDTRLGLLHSEYKRSL